MPSYLGGLICLRVAGPVRCEARFPAQEWRGDAALLSMDTRLSRAVIRATNSIAEAMVARDSGRIRFIIEGKK